MCADDRQLPLFPLERLVLFPGMSLPLHVFEDRYKLMVATCQVTDRLFGVVLIRRGREVGEAAEPENVGCTARIVDVERLGDGRLNVLAVGEQRFRLVERAAPTPDGYLSGRVCISRTSEEVSEVPRELLATVQAEYRAYRSEVIRLGARPAWAETDELPTDPDRLSYRVAATLRVNPRELQRLLEADDAATRLRQALVLLKRESRTLQLMLRARGGAQPMGPFSVN